MRTPSRRVGGTGQDGGTGRDTSLSFSDHYHPPLERQPEAESFVRSVIDALSQAVPLPVQTAATCPLTPIRLAAVAQTAATDAVQLDDRFRLGISSGKALNEHILGDAWPEADVRLEKLEEAVQVTRELPTGEQTGHRGKHYTVENARLYTVPTNPPHRRLRLRPARRRGRRPHRRRLHHHGAGHHRHRTVPTQRRLNQTRFHGTQGLPGSPQGRSRPYDAPPPGRPTTPRRTRPAQLLPTPEARNPLSQVRTR
ncbi:LLM class flavin-dependent oxidoreductase [Streptomyces sp. NPDC058470]|uniref:LLM class flavin-dependent oxidoreductase n=1 Tax=Streptomyces sp. NPDC058470 TaxID=3346515 RepID=UPI00365F6ABF